MNNSLKHQNLLKKQLLQFPEPDIDAQQNSQALVALICDEIEREGGKIPFECFMALSLTAPGLGYYSAGNQKIGVHGDFVTAPEISPLFSRCIASQCQQVLSQLDQAGEAANILEFGAGTGTMAAEILLELERLQCLPHCYYILEVSADLQQRQRETIRRSAPHLEAAVIWLKTLPQQDFRGIVLANEVLDALPVHRFYKTAKSVGEYYVAWNGQQFVWELGEICSDSLANVIDRLEKDLPDNYQSEVNLAANAWVASLADFLQQGIALIIDYGFPQREYYHVQRSQGTLMCHYRHRAHDDPFVYPGLQDITAHVDFTAVAEAAANAGLDVAGYNTQGFFLLANGLEKFVGVADISDPEYLKTIQQIKTLTMPHEMGELFKVMALSKNYDCSLQGFQFQDLRAKL
ncbi:MAG: SAM-dependent methyltransferase [Gammaproteobacteria bacterium]|nr:SAM-dependent methyltransferase [Gammaproteobacteria bacterium]